MILSENTATYFVHLDTFRQINSQFMFCSRRGNACLLCVRCVSFSVCAIVCRSVCLFYCDSFVFARLFVLVCVLRVSVLCVLWD